MKEEINTMYLKTGQKLYNSDHVILKLDIVNSTFIYRSVYRSYRDLET